LIIGMLWLMWRGPWWFDGKYLETKSLRTGSAALVTGFRTVLVQILAVLGASVALTYTARTYRLAHRGQVTDRFSKALERLSSSELYVRLSGIITLEQILQDAPDQATHAARVLNTFIQERTPTKTSSALPLRRSVVEARRAARQPAPEPVHATTRPDVPPSDIQAALTALTRPASRTNVAGSQAICLAGLHLVSASFAGADLHGADLRRADLRRARLGRADFREAWLGSADLRDAILTHTDFRNADLDNADLRGANLREADLRGASLFGADLRGLHLNRLNFDGTNLATAHLTGAHLRGAHLEGAYLRGAHLEGADLSRADLFGAQLGEADLRGADFREADLRGARLSGADLRGAHLEGADLSRADLRGAQLDGADLHGAQLFGAHVDGACFTGADLEGADLRGTEGFELEQLLTARILLASPLLPEIVPPLPGEAPRIGSPPP
jgi:uncharacterized protein YjbI with pentapeptide repeats